MVEDDEGGEEEEFRNTDIVTSAEAVLSADREKNVDTLGLSYDDISALRLLIYDGGDISDDTFERINEAFLESFIGDIILEHDGEKYTVIVDYRADVEGWLADLNK